MKTKLLFVILLAGFFIKADLPAYYIYNKDGKQTSYDELLKKASNADVVLFGELHNNAVAHWLQLELTKGLKNENKGNVIMGAEMFEADQQLIINEFLDGQISDKNFENEARLWPNYKTDYKPLLQFARNNHIPFIATNVPRRYASFVAKNGLDSLNRMATEEARSYMTPLPFELDLELPGYKNMMHEGGGAMKYLPHAQALKDATMGWFIVNNLDKKKTFIHFHGTYHSNNFEGIYWYLNKYKAGLKIVTIATVEQADILKFDEQNLNLADFIITVDEDFTKTH